MDCERVRLMLDAYIDGELTPEEERALTEHARACEACREEMEAAMLLRDSLKDMVDEIVVPLEAQAAWRRAVKAEAGKKNTRKWMRMAYAAAAVVVLLVGGTAALRMAPVRENAQTLIVNEDMSRTVRLIEADGVDEASAHGTVSAVDACSVWKKIASDNPDQARENLAMLAAEYSGSYAEDKDGICRIELPYEYLEDFLNAASRIGTEQHSQISGEATKTAVVLIQINEE